ncbi:MAG: hypothetical protein U0W40_20540 [Acidimicrobiia bacterium]
MDHLVAVYRDRETPRRVAEALLADGVAPDHVHIGTVAGDARARHAEMEAEVQKSWGGALIGTFLTGEMLRGVAVFVAVLVPVGAVLGALAGWLLFTESSDTWVRLGVGALIGGLFGFVVGGVLGGGFAMNSGVEPLAVEEGITVDVAGPPLGTEHLLREFGAIRIDRFADDAWLRTEFDEGPSGVTENVKETARQFREHAADPRRR